MQVKEKKSQENSARRKQVRQTMLCVCRSQVLVLVSSPRHAAWLGGPGPEKRQDHDGRTKKGPAPAFAPSGRRARRLAQDWSRTSSSAELVRSLHGMGRPTTNQSSNAMQLLRTAGFKGELLLYAQYSMDPGGVLTRGSSELKKKGVCDVCVLCA
ncbi:hypothetical protein GGI42DRAFT_48575 [Trichoderma sp. SZMC 28013]